MFLLGMCHVLVRLGHTMLVQTHTVIVQSYTDNPYQTQSIIVLMNVFLVSVGVYVGVRILGC